LLRRANLLFERQRKRAGLGCEAGGMRIATRGSEGIPLLSRHKGHGLAPWPSASIGPMVASFPWEAAMTPMQTAERDIEELRQSIRRMFSDLLSLSLEAHDRAAISKGIQSLQDDLRWGQEKFERGN